MGNENKTLFVTHTYGGPRFGAGRFPVEVLPELAAYRELLVELAKAIFFQRHPNRDRIPKGFSDRLVLTFDHVEAGSAVAPLLRFRPELPLFQNTPIADGEDEFDRARDLLNECIGSAQRGVPPPSGFPPELLAGFRSFGRLLREDETLDLSLPAQGSPARYSAQVRERLIRRIPSDARHLQEVTIVGRVFQANANALSYGVQLDDGRSIQAQYTIHLEPSVLSALRYHGSVKVRVRGLGKTSDAGVLERVVETYELEIVEDAAIQGPDIDSRIAALKELQPGWLDGEGEAFRPDELDEVATTLKHVCYERELPAPHLYPEAPRTLLAEWTFGTWEVSCAFDFVNAVAGAFAIDTRTDAEDACELGLHDPNLPEALGEWVARFLESREA